MPLGAASEMNYTVCYCLLYEILGLNGLICYGFNIHSSVRVNLMRNASVKLSALS